LSRRHVANYALPDAARNTCAGIFTAVLNIVYDGRVIYRLITGLYVPLRDLPYVPQSGSVRRCEKAGISGPAPHVCLSTALHGWRLASTSVALYCPPTWGYYVTR